MRFALRNGTRRQAMWPAVTSLVVSVTMLAGCGTRGVTQVEPETPQPESPQPEATQPAEPQPVVIERPAERPAFLDFLAEATPADDPLPPGQPLPELAAEGWINGPPSKAAGTIVVVECWAYW